LQWPGLLDCIVGVPDVVKREVAEGAVVGGLEDVLERRSLIASWLTAWSWAMNIGHTAGIWRASTRSRRQSERRCCIR